MRISSLYQSLLGTSWSDRCALVAYEHEKPPRRQCLQSEKRKPCDGPFTVRELAGIYRNMRAICGPCRLRSQARSRCSPISLAGIPADCDHQCLAKLALSDLRRCILSQRNLPYTAQQAHALAPGAQNSTIVDTILIVPSFWCDTDFIVEVTMVVSCRKSDSQVHVTSLLID